jgi:hypothetical protein
LRTPFDFQATEALTNWRDELYWPVLPATLHCCYSRYVDRYLQLISDTKDENERNVILLMNSLSTGLPLLESALSLQEAAKAGVPLQGGPEGTEFLSESSHRDIIASTKSTRFNVLQSSRAPTLASFRVSQRWHSPLNFLAAMAKPEARIISTNPLLLEAACQMSTRSKYLDPTTILKSGRKLADQVANDNTVQDLASRISLVLADEPLLEEDYKDRLRKILRHHLLDLLPSLVREMDGLSKVSSIPDRIWSGTGSKYASRALGIEVLRRGGEVRRFDHASTLGILYSPEFAASLELSVSSHYIFPSDFIAKNVTISGALNKVASYRDIEIEVFERRSSPAPKPVRPPSNTGRRKVYYVPTMVRSQGRHVFSAVPPIMYLDWQLRLASMMVEEGIDLICKPHPEGVFENRRHALEEVAEVDYRRFEETVSDADIFVFDRNFSTTFALALATDRPVVYIDLGAPNFHQAVDPLVASRCHVLQASYDDRNLPQIDARELSDAINSSPVRVDSDEFSHLLFGTPENEVARFRPVQ